MPKNKTPRTMHQIGLDQGWIRGCAYAIAEMERGQSAEMILDSSGITHAELREAKVDPFDAGPVKQLIRKARKP